MKFLLGLCLLFALSLNSFGAPLIFKAEKEITKAEFEQNKFIELGLFDVSGYKQIRVGIRSNNDAYSQEILIQGVDGEDTYRLIWDDDRYLSKTYLLDSPPDKIKISVKGVGKYKLRVWATK